MPETLYEVLREEYVRLHEQEPPELTGEESEPDKLKGLFAAIHKLERPRTALCISGGGIRSATFALGVMQRLARLGVLSQFDFLSTVSGGGYIGSWLSSFARRTPNGIEGVADQLTGGVKTTGDPLKPEVEPLTWLRQFSNYLTPRLGLLSGDTWAFAASYIRNLLLVWLMYVPLLLAALAVPRLSIALMRLEHNTTLYAVIAGVMIAISTTVLALTRPVSFRTQGWLTNGRFMFGVLLPLFIAAICIVLCWGMLYDEPNTISWFALGLIMVGSSAFASIVYMVRFIGAAQSEALGNVREDSSKNRYTAKKFAHEVIASMISGVVAAALLYLAFSKLFSDPMKPVELPTLKSWMAVPPSLSTAPGELFLCLGVPLVLGILFLQSAIFVGGASWFNEEYDREWWGRGSGWVLAVAVVWIAFTGIAVYGPIAIFEAPRTFAAIGGITGLFSILGGRSDKTAATEKEADDTARPATTAMSIALSLVGPVFVVAILSLLSLCTSEALLHLRHHRTISDEEVALAERGSHQIVYPEEIGKYKANFQTSRFAAIETDKLHALEHLWIFDETTVGEGLALVFGLAILGYLASFFIGVNQFSMHGLYRNRLIRAYLGASRYSRRPNAFSGFDPHDNVAMHRLRPEMLWTNSFTNIFALAPLLKADKELKPMIDDATFAAIDEASKMPDGDEKKEACLAAGELLAHDLNHVIDTADLDPDAEDQYVPRAVRNRRAIEKRFPKTILNARNHMRPMHVVNMTLNLVAGDNLGWQERKAESFAASPVSAGCWRLGYRPTRYYGGPSGLSLGTAVAISGAAASPNMGYNSSPALSFLLTLFNVRLGWWLGNPKDDDAWMNRNPTNSLIPFLAESFGYTNDTFPYVYLSDGGHFENLALYEMVLRRCKYIIVSDGGADPKCSFDDLGNAIRKIRIDFGISITIDWMGILPRPKKEANAKYCAVGTIHYEDVDRDAKPGRLLYIKPSFYGDLEPKDVYNYAISNPTFPHQSTGDQWFSESQFESYRALGDFTVGEITKGTPISNVSDVISAAGSYAKP